MLENVNLKRKLAREEYKDLVPVLQRRLYDLEKASWDSGIGSLIVLEGWDASGKGTAISTLTQRLDPRGFKLYAINPPRTYEQSRPWLWRFWLKVPNRGEMVIFDQSWYSQILAERIEQKCPPKQWRDRLRDIVDFERTLADDGTVFLKFFLHISKKEQKTRFREIEKNPLESWRVTDRDWQRNKRYEEYRERIEEMLELTESEFAPWTIVESTSRWHSRRKIFDTIIAALEHRLGANAPPPSKDGPQAKKDADLRAVSERLEGER